MKSAGMSHLEVGVTIAVDHFPRATMKHTLITRLAQLTANAWEEGKCSPTH